MTLALYREDAYQQECSAQVTKLGDGCVELDQTVMFAASGGQPGDKGSLLHDGGSCTVTDTIIDRDSGAIRHLLGEGSPPPPGAQVTLRLDWEHRHKVMRTHTALHLLYAAVRLPVTSGNMHAGSGRLDFDMPEPPEREEIEGRLASMVAADYPVTTKWVTWDYLDANPELVKSMAVRPPRVASKVSLVAIDDGKVDIQACGGTHVRSTAEVGTVRIAKVSKKGRINRRVAIALEG